MEINTIIVMSIIKAFSRNITDELLQDLLLLSPATAKRIIYGHKDAGHWPREKNWPPKDLNYLRHENTFAQQLEYVLEWCFDEYLDSNLDNAKRTIVAELKKAEIQIEEIGRIVQMTDFSSIAKHLVNCAQSEYARRRAPKRATQTQMPAIAWCPLKNRAQAQLDKDYFHGRKELIADIRKRLEQHQNSPVFLWGVGGIGKTALACHFASYEAKQYKVFFTTYSNSFRETIAKLDLRNLVGDPITTSDMTEDQRYELHMQALRKCAADVVLIIDNADSGTDLTSQDEYSALCLLEMQFIITTRNDMKGDGRALYVGELSDNDCIDLMIQYYPFGINKKNELRKISEIFHNHTLSVELVAKSLEESGGLLTTTKVLDALQTDATVDGDDWEQIRREYGIDNKEKRLIQHLASVFEVASLPPLERYVLGDLALANGMFQSNEIKNYWSRKEGRLIHRLHAKGWIAKEKGVFMLHPVIRCVVLFKREQCISWEGNGEFVLSTMIYANVGMMHKKMKSTAGFRGFHAVMNSLKYMLDLVPNTYVGFLCSFFMYCCWAMGEILPKKAIDQLYDRALISCESNSIVKYLIYDSYYRVLCSQDVDFDEKMSTYKKVNNMIWSKREHYYISNEILDVIKRRISFLQGIHDEVDDSTFTTIYSNERLMYELYILGWMVNDKELELNSAFLWASEICYGQDIALWSPVVANAQMHMGEKDVKFFDAALNTIKSVLRWPGRTEQNYYGVMAGVAEIAIRICEIGCKSNEREEWQQKLMEAKIWLKESNS